MNTTRETRSTPWTSLALMAAVAVPLGTACSLTLDFADEVSCSVDGDCQYSSGQGTCQDGICVAPGGAEGGNTGGDENGGTMNVTTDETAGSGESAAGTVTAGDETPTDCTVNTDCDVTERCGGAGTCETLLSSECNKVRWPGNVGANSPDRNNVVYIGSMNTTSEAIGELIQPLENATELALDHFNEETTLQGDRKVAWIACDTTPIGSAEAAANHLVNVVGVPAIVGPVFSDEALIVAGITVPAGVFMMTGTASSPSVTNYDDNDLIWRVIGGDQFQANAIVDEIESYINEKDSDLAGGGRILVMNLDSTYGSELRGAIETRLGEEVTGNVIQYRAYDNPRAEEFIGDTDALAIAIAADVRDAMLALPNRPSGVDDQPIDSYDSPADYYSLIVIIGTTEAEIIVSNILGWYGLDATAAGSFKPPVALPFPRFVVSNGVVAQTPLIVSRLGDAPGTEGLAAFRSQLVDAMRGIAPVIFDPDNFPAYSFVYGQSYDDPQDLSVSGLSYDATMSTLLAMTKIGPDEEITGTAIAAAMPALNDPIGTAISFEVSSDNTFISEARNALTIEGGTINVQGVSGRLDWDESTGTTRVDNLRFVVIDEGGGSFGLGQDRCYELNKGASDGVWGPVDPDPTPGGIGPEVQSCFQ